MTSSDWPGELWNGPHDGACVNDTDVALIPVTETPEITDGIHVWIPRQLVESSDSEIPGRDRRCHLYVWDGFFTREGAWLLDYQGPCSFEEAVTLLNHIRRRRPAWPVPNSRD